VTSAGMTPVRVVRPAHTIPVNTSIVVNPA
jgi:hypothetical protein